MDTLTKELFYRLHQDSSVAISGSPASISNQELLTSEEAVPLSPWPPPSFTVDEEFWPTVGTDLGLGGSGLNVTYAAIATKTPAMPNKNQISSEVSSLSSLDFPSSVVLTVHPVEETTSPGGVAGHRSLRL